MPKKWTEKDIEELKILIEKYSNREISSILDTTYDSVKSVLRDRNIKRSSYYWAWFIFI